VDLFELSQYEYISMIKIELKHAKPCKLTMVTYNVNQALYSAINNTY